MADHRMTLLLAFDVLVTIAWIISLHGHRAALLSLARECDELVRLGELVTDGGER